MDLLKGLNNMQSLAVTTTEGPLLILAGAGSGKTRTIIHRIAYILNEGLARPYEILALTFTNKAAQEMKTRISARLETLSREKPEDLRLARQMILVEQASISTIHSFCLDLIRQNFQKLDLQPDFRIADERETALMRQGAAEEVVEDAYRREEQPFLDLVELSMAVEEEFGLGEMAEEDIKGIRTVGDMVDFVAEASK